MRRVWTACLACVLLLAAGCGRKIVSSSEDLPIVYDLGERLPHAVAVQTWTNLDLGQDSAREFLISGWDDVRGAPDGTPARWTTQRTATVRLFLAEPTDLDLTVYCDPYTRSRQKQSLTLQVNGRAVHSQHLPRSDRFKTYDIRIPAGVLRRGENVLGFKARYVSKRHRKALRFSRLETKNLGDAAASAEPPARTKNGWIQGPGTRASWRIVVPRSGSLQVQPAFEKPGDQSECSVCLRLSERRITLASFSSSADGPVQIDLSEFGGQRGVLEFETFGQSPVEWKGAIVRGLVEPRDVNVMIFTIDTLRPDHVGAYGYPRDTTPALDRLARKGTIFLNAYANSNESGPSHASILTGRYPQSHGLFTNARKLHPQQITLAHILGRAGYRTACYVNFAILRQGNTTGKGFENRTAVPGTPKTVTLAGLKHNVFGNAYRWTRALWQEPQFTWIHSQFLHMEDLPAPYHRMFWQSDATQTEPQSPGRRFFPLLTETDRRAVRVAYNQGQTDLTPSEMEAVVAYYDGGIRFSDDYIGLVLEGLADLGLDPFTACVITSDHGVSLGERHAVSHRGPPYDHLLKVPLILVLPGSGQVPGGRVEGLVELADVAPTILDYLGQRIPRRMQGTSLLPLVRDPEGAGKDAVYAAVPDVERNPYYSVRTPDGRYFMDLQGKEYLALAVEDPAIHSVADQHPELRERLKGELLHWVKVTPDLVSKKDDAVSPEVAEMLRKAGYLDASQ
ncbi:MAG: sulfatase-like hydrolase/transferase [Kiritimatiellae bacterium]|nr:sulfatase-like hydrolase/transferase [Kiritimatiellia bacterium]